ncbi:MAG: hypothetical protein OEX80_06455 [Candidatus Aminicenantes bacterium]|nr:hypothetical protein [Candidatus Aminicenantes bacterium]
MILASPLRGSLKEQHDLCFERRVTRRDNRHTHQGKRCQSRAQMETFIDGLRLAK